MKELNPVQNEGGEARHRCNMSNSWFIANGIFLFKHSFQELMTVRISHALTILMKLPRFVAVPDSSDSPMMPSLPPMTTVVFMTLGRNPCPPP